MPDGADFDNLSLAGFAASAVEKLRAQAQGQGTEREQATDALALLVRSGRESGVRIDQVRLKNFGGVTEAEVKFAPTGVTIVHGTQRGREIDADARNQRAVRSP